VTEEILQGSPDWLTLRVGRVTSSRISDLLAGGKGLTRAAYRNQIVAERLTGIPCDDGYENDHMRRGTEQEPFSRAAYEVKTGVMVDMVPFVAHPRLMAGASPDGLVGDDGGIEMKNSATHTHIGYLEDDRVPPKYIAQMQWAMACTGRVWWDFVSYRADLPVNVRLFVKRLKRDDDWIKKTEAEVEKFLAEVDEMVERLIGPPPESVQAPEDLIAALKASLAAKP
jgi:predicted phage-related endonuclease